MAGKTVLDQYDQWAVITKVGGVAATGADTHKLETGITNLQKVAWAVDLLELSIPQSWWGKLAGLADYVLLSLQAAQTWLVPLATNASVMVWHRLALACTPALLNNYIPQQDPIVREFHPERPMLFLPSSIYFGLGWNVAAGLTAESACWRIHYKEVELGPEDWYDLLQLRIPLGSF